MWDVGADGPGKVLGADGHSVESHLDTIVLDRATVHVDRTIACRNCGVHRLQNVVGLFVIDINAQGESVLHNAEVDTCIILCGGLPFQVGIGNLAGVKSYCVLTTACGILHVAIGVLCGIGRDTLVTGHTPTKAQFQVAQPLAVLQEILLIDAPG